MKINIHTDQFIPPADSKPSRHVPSTAARSLADELSSTPTGSTISSNLQTISNNRAARVAQLTALYQSGNYKVNSTLVAQSLVSGAIA